MAKVRCKQTKADSFFGNFLYDQKVSKDHFLKEGIFTEVIRGGSVRTIDEIKMGEKRWRMK